LKTVENPFSFEDLRKSVLMEAIGLVPAIIGLIYVIMRFVAIDLFLQGPTP
jgi:hypothetical protein